MHRSPAAPILTHYYALLTVTEQLQINSFVAPLSHAHSSRQVTLTILPCAVHVYVCASSSVRLQCCSLFASVGLQPRAPVAFTQPAGSQFLLTHCYTILPSTTTCIVHGYHILLSSKKKAHTDHANSSIAK